MPKVDLVATKDFTYNTRRLVAGDPFQARNPMDARILELVRRVAELAKPPGALVEEAPRILATEEVVEAPKKPTVKKAPKARARKAKAKK